MHDLVKRYMMHGPCGILREKSMHSMQGVPNERFHTFKPLGISGKKMNVLQLPCLEFISTKIKSIIL